MPVRHLFGVLLAGGLALSGCSLLPGGDPAPPGRQEAPGLTNTAWRPASRDTVARGGTLRLATTAIPANFNPLQADNADSEAAKIFAPTTGNAIRVTADGGWRVDPDYAESVTVTDKKPLTVQVKLNRNAVWQAGTAITANDMVAFWKAQNGSNSDFEVSSTAGYQDIAKVQPGKGEFSYTVVFKKPIADWPQYVYPRLPAGVSSSPKLFNTGFRTKAISSNGPYVITAIDATRGAVTERRNPRWWGAAPRLKAILWHAAEPAVQAKAFAAGELDAVDLDASNYAIAGSTGLRQRARGLEWTQLTLNGARGPLKDVDVRRAVAHAIDRSRIAGLSAANVRAPGSPLGSLIYLPGQRGYRDSSRVIAYDPARSRSLLAKAGYRRGSDGTVRRKGKPLRLTMPVAAETPTNRDRSRRIAADLKKVGIGVRLRTVPASKFFNRYVVALDFDLVTFSWRGSAFPVAAAEPLFYPVDSGQNFTGLEDDTTAAVWDEAKAELDDKRRARLVGELDARLLADVPMVPLAVTPIVFAVRKTLRNYGAAQFEQPDWTAVGFSTK